MKKKKKVLLISLIGLVVIFIVLAVISSFLFTANEKIETVQDMITEQSEKEKEIKSTGYTIDSPNVILNPYGNSPLTALVVFETEDEVSPEVTIVGKDELSTYTHTFDKGTKHYLSIYWQAQTNNLLLIYFLYFGRYNTQHS